jgi:IS5 family transposase
LLDSLPKAQWLLGDRGYDADWFRDALEEKGITPCIPGRTSRTKPVKYNKRRYKSRNKIEIMSIARTPPAWAALMAGDR